MFDLNYCSTYGSLFNASFVRRVTENQHRDYLTRLFYESKLDRSLTEHHSLGHILSSIYEVLNKHYRCEYVYKNILANEVFSQRHCTFKNASLLTELSADGRIADAVVANGTTTAYEIKTDLDSFARLSSQISSYLKIFEFVYIVVSEALVEKAKKSVPGEVGIIAVSGTNSLITERKAESNLPRLEPARMFDTLRQKEFKRIVESEFGSLRDVPAGMLYTHCRETALRLPTEAFHSHFVDALRARTNRNDIEDCIIDSPTALRALTLSSELSKAKLRRFTTALSSAWC